MARGYLMRVRRERIENPGDKRKLLPMQQALTSSASTTGGPQFKAVTTPGPNLLGAFQVGVGVARS
jgi:hypothetical protein